MAPLLRQFFKNWHTVLGLDQPTERSRQWLFCRRQQIALGIYFAVIIHVCLYSQIC